jgi:hypothetical protein
MKLDFFSQKYELIDKTETDKVAFLAFFLHQNNDEQEFTVSDVSSIIFALGFAKPNQTRLKSNITKSSWFIKGSKQGFFKLSAKKLSELRIVIPDVLESEDVISDDSILPEILLKETGRPYLIKLAQQINSAYENNLFDACSLMMRRLLEVLLIHCFESAGIDNAVKDDDGNFKNLKTLINTAISRVEIKISNDVKKDIDKFRELGNLSAHRVKYNCRRDDIRVVRLDYRAVVEELLYASNLVKASS